MKWAFMRYNTILLEREMDWAGKPPKYPGKTFRDKIKGKRNVQQHMAWPLGFEFASH